jgi:GT2 family glycosyltransferase
MPALTWVIVSYGGVQDAAALIASLQPVTTEDVEFVLACNRVGDAADARTRLAVDLAAGRVRIVDNPHNPGYLPAVARALKDVGTGGHVVFSNADLRGEAASVSALLAEFSRWPDALSLAPSIVGSIGRDVNPHLLRPPTARRLRVLAALHRFPVAADLLLLRRNGHGSSLPAAGRPGQLMWAGHGSCVALSSEFFARGGDLGYPYALFGEELWIGTEVARLGGEVRYVPSVRLLHREHAATGSGRRRGWLARVKYEGLRYWARRSRVEGWH